MAFAMLHPITVCFLDMHSSDFKCHYPVSLVISLSESYFIMVITSFADMFMSMATPFDL